MEKKRLGNILFWVTLVSPMLSFSLAGSIGESNIFGVAGIIRYSWVMWLFVPIGILSILVGSKLKNSQQKYKKNFIIAFICLPLLMVFGSYRFIFSDMVSYDINEVLAVETKMDLDMPDNIKVATMRFDSYHVSYIKIVDSESKSAFEQEIRTNELWKNELNDAIKGLLPIDIQYESETFEYYMFYNMTSDEYNKFPQNDECECIFVAYDCDGQRLIMVEPLSLDYI